MSNSLKCPILVNRQNSNILGKLGDFVKFYGKIPDILVLITGHFGLFKTPTLKLRETGKTQTQSQTRRLRIAKNNFKSVRKTIEIAKNEIPELAKKSDYCPSMSKTRQCLKTLNGGNLDTVQEFWDRTVLKIFSKF